MDEKPAGTQPQSQGEFTPGETAVAQPEAQPTTTSNPNASPTAPEATLPSPQSSATEASPELAPQPGPESEPSFAPSLVPPPVEMPDGASPAQTPQKTQLAWTASNFIAHSKSPQWYLALAGVSVGLAAIVFILFKDKISTVVVLAAGLCFGVYASRPSQQIQYAVDDRGVNIGDKYFPFAQFRSFSVTDEEHLSSVALYPLKRFGLLMTLYFEPEQEDAVVGAISGHLPLEPHHEDLIDGFMKRIGF